MINLFASCAFKDGLECSKCYLLDDDGLCTDHLVMNTVPMRLGAAHHTVMGLNRPSNILACPTNDFFGYDGDEWRHWAWGMIKLYPQHQWFLATKRPDRIPGCLPPDWGEGYPNVWLGVVVQHQKDADERLPILSLMPAVAHFALYQPALGPVDFTKVKADAAQLFAAPDGEQVSDLFNAFEDFEHVLDWVFVSGESGNEPNVYKYRPAKLSWFSSVISQCRANKVPVYIDRLGYARARSMALNSHHGDNPQEWPRFLRVRHMPEIKEQDLPPIEDCQPL